LKSRLEKKTPKRECGECDWPEKDSERVNPCLIIEGESRSLEKGGTLPNRNSRGEKKKIDQPDPTEQDWKKARGCN